MNEDKRTIRVVAAVIENDGRYLVTKRRPTAVLPDLWEFPGGKVEPAEDDAVALKREFIERLAAPIAVGELISYVRHPYEKYTVELFLYSCNLLSDTLTCKGVAEYAWITSKEFDDYMFTPADEQSMNQLLGE
ncbi:MAG: (deoxy)nucleoside triphosphate pyrophosphohydrolase [Deltaproteobacteria bacterium]|nr:(deoxy)nucleoside triphosphate pyrophosphohydrolase [Deltaproteobacteria bacterium]